MKRALHLVLALLVTGTVCGNAPRGLVVCANQDRQATRLLRLHEQYNFVFDQAGNLLYRTNGSLVQGLVSDPANQLTNITRNGTLTVSGATPAPATNVTVNGLAADRYSDLTFARAGVTLQEGPNTFTIIAHNAYGTKVTNVVNGNLPVSVTLHYDSNGNLTNDGTRSFSYDAENRLVTNWVAGAWKTEFVYDALGRRRVERLYDWQSGWSKTSELHFIYDGWQLVQVRHASNNVLETYTRGLDLSGSLAGAGGIGGLLARTDGNGSLFYHADGAGNVTALMNSTGNVPGRYEYGPFGRRLGMWGAMADLNRFRFSSKPHLPYAEDLYDFGARQLTTIPQRWLQRDPMGEAGGVNLYQFVGNDPVNLVDPYGLELTYYYSQGGLLQPSGTTPYIIGENFGENLLASVYNTIPVAANALDRLFDPVTRLLDAASEGTENVVMRLTGAPEAGEGARNLFLLGALLWSKKCPPTAEGGSLLPVKYDPKFAAEQLLGGNTVTPGGRTIMDHAARRMVNPPAGRAGMTMQEIDQVLDTATKIKKVTPHPMGTTVTVQHPGMPGQPQVVVDGATGQRVITVIKQN